MHRLPDSDNYNYGNVKDPVTNNLSFIQDEKASWSDVVVADFNEAMSDQTAGGAAEERLHHQFNQKNFNSYHQMSGGLNFDDLRRNNSYSFTGYFPNFLTEPHRNIELPKHLKFLQDNLSPSSFKELQTKDPTLDTSLAMDLLSKEHKDSFESQDAIRRNINNEIQKNKVIKDEVNALATPISRFTAGLVASAGALATNPYNYLLIPTAPLVETALTSIGLTSVIGSIGSRIAGAGIINAEITALQQPWKLDFMEDLGIKYTKSDAINAVINSGWQGILFGAGIEGAGILAGTVGSTVGAGIGLAKSGLDTVIDTGFKVGDAVKDGAGKVVDSVKDRAGKVVDSVKDRAGSVVDSVKDRAGSAVDSIKDRAGSAVDSIKDGVGKVTDAIPDQLKEKADSLSNYIRSKINESNIDKQTLLDIKDKLYDFSLDNYKNISNKLGEALNKLPDDEYMSMAKRGIDRVINIMKDKPKDVEGSEYIKTVEDNYVKLDQGEKLEKPNTKEEKTPSDGVVSSEIKELEKKLQEQREKEYKFLFGEDDFSPEDMAAYYKTIDDLEKETGITDGVQASDENPDFQKLLDAKSKGERAKAKARFDNSPVGKFIADFMAKVDKTFYKGDFIKNELKSLEKAQKDLFRWQYDVSILKKEQEAFLKSGINSSKILQEFIDKWKKLNDKEIDIKKTIKTTTQNLDLFRKAHDAIFNYRDRNGQADIVEGLASQLSQDSSFKGTSTHVEARSNKYLNQALFQNFEFVDKFSVNAKSLKEHYLSFFEERNADIDNLVHGMYGAEIDKDLRSILDNINKTNDFFHQENLKYGVDVNTLENWNKPQTHDAFKIGNTKFEFQSWLNFIRDRFDWGKMFEVYKNKLIREGKLKNPSNYKPISIEELARIIFDNIRTRGLSDIGKDKTAAGDVFSNDRVVFFKDAKSDIEYNKEYGRGDLFDTMTEHWYRASNRLALMEKFGSEPNQYFRALKEAVHTKVLDTTTKRGVDYLLKELKLSVIDKNYEILSGKNRQPFMIEKYFTNVLRPLTYATKLGSTTIASVADLASYMSTMTGSNISSGRHLKEFFNHLKDIKDDGERAEMVRRIGLVSEMVRTIPSRFGEMNIFNMPQKITDFVIRASGLDHWTQKLKDTFSSEFAIHIASNFGKGYSDIHPFMKRQLQKYHIGSDEWNQIRSVGHDTINIDGKEVNFFTPHKLSSLESTEAVKDLQTKVFNMFENEMNTAVTTPNTRQRSWATAGKLLDNELYKSTFGVFKTFPLTITMNQFARLMDAKATGSMASYMSNLLIWGVITGAIIKQTNNLLNGKTPEDMGNAKFVAAALAQGDFGGYLGQQLLEDQNEFFRRFGGASSPIMGTLGKVKNLTIGNIQTLFGLSDQKHTHFVQDAWALGRDLRPNWWFTKPMEVYLKDRVDYIADPNYEKKLAIIRGRASKKGQSLWIQPSPDSQPNSASKRRKSTMPSEARADITNDISDDIKGDFADDSERDMVVKSILNGIEQNN